MSDWEKDDLAMHRADIVANTISQPDDAVRCWISDRLEETQGKS